MEMPRATVACSKSLIESLIHALDGNAWVSISVDQNSKAECEGLHRPRIPLCRLLVEDRGGTRWRRPSGTNNSHKILMNAEVANLLAPT